jgi:hypothetical protein
MNDPNIFHVTCVRCGRNVLLCYDTDHQQFCGLCKKCHVLTTLQNVLDNACTCTDLWKQAHDNHMPSCPQANRVERIQ